MKRILQLLPIILLVLLQLHCSDIFDPLKFGYISVFVYSGGNQTVSGIKVEIVQTGEVKKTNENGIAEFQVNPGNYTVRVYDIQGPGPKLLGPVEFSVAV